MTMANDVPVLIIFFNRENTVISLIGMLSKVKPSMVYLASDGGRDSFEHNRVLNIRKRVLEAIDWECEVHEKINETNLGCKYAVHSAVQWFFGNVSEGIVLEDDCIPSRTFFTYASIMLDKYRDVSNIASIAARNEVLDFVTNEPIFCTKFFCWGWASWADRIRHIDVETGYRRGSLKPLLTGVGYYEAQHLRGMHSLMLCNQVNSWAYSYDFAFRKQSKVHLIPPVNYVTNIGVGSGTHQYTGQQLTDISSIDSDVVLSRPDGKPTSNSAYLFAYLRQKYSYIKILLFPWIGHIKWLQKLIS